MNLQLILETIGFQTTLFTHTAWVMHGRLNIEKLVEILKGEDENRFELVFGEQSSLLHNFLLAAEERKRNGEVETPGASNGATKRGTNNYVGPKEAVPNVGEIEDGSDSEEEKDDEYEEDEDNLEDEAAEEYEDSTRPWV